jgi:hypothetical protein
VIAGVIAALADAIGLTRYIQALLFQTSPLDALSLTAVNTLFLIVALSAGLVPAVAGRAARSDVRGPAGMTGVAPAVATGRTLRPQ